MNRAELPNRNSPPRTAAASVREKSEAHRPGRIVVILIVRLEGEMMMLGMRAEGGWPLFATAKQAEGRPISQFVGPNGPNGECRDVAIASAPAQPGLAVAEAEGETTAVSYTKNSKFKNSHKKKNSKKSRELKKNSKIHFIS